MGNAKSYPKQILILTADAGFGHRSAANAIAASLEQKYGGLVNVEIVNPLADKRTPFFLRDSQSDYDKIVRNMPELYRMGYESSDALLPTAILESSLTVLLFEVMLDMLKKYQPDVIITTYPLYQAPLVGVLSIHRVFIPVYTVITDLVTVHRLWFNNHIDGYLVPNQEVANLASDYHISENKIEITGIPVSPFYALNKISKPALRKELGWEQDTPTILAVGSRRVEQLEAALNIVNHFGQKIQLIAVAGNDNTLFQQLKGLDWHIPVHIYEFVSNMPRFLIASDGLITKAGGLIVTEALAAGLPMMLIDIIPGQETGNAEYVVSNGAGEISLEPLEVLQSLAHWFQDDLKLLKEQSENARAIGKPDSGLRIAETLWNAPQPQWEKEYLFAPDLRDGLLELLGRYKIPLPRESIFTRRK